jgi:predicted kinase
MRTGAQFRPVLVLMAGLPGAGKTTLSTALGHITGWHVLHKDEVKDAFLLQGLADKEASWHAYETSFKHIYDVLVKKQRSIIFDTSASNPFVLDRAQELTNAACACLKVVHCHVNENIRFQRLEGRPNRTGPLDLDTLSVENRLLLFQHLPQNTLHLNTERHLNTCIDIVQQYFYCSKD